MENMNREGDSHPTVRLARYLAQRSEYSRRTCERLILDGRVSVNGKIVQDVAVQVDPASDEVRLDTLPLTVPASHLYIALNKPVGFLSSFSKQKERGRMLGELVKVDRRLFTAGRLDRETSGLLLLTSDGDWANRAMHPRYEKEKEYVAIFRSISPETAVKRLKWASFKEKGRLFSLKDAKVQNGLVTLTLTEGRYHQIRRLAQSVELDLIVLIRIRIGSVRLGKLKVGSWRKLTMPEIESFR